MSINVAMRYRFPTGSDLFLHRPNALGRASAALGVSKPPWQLPSLGLLQPPPVLCAVASAHVFQCSGRGTRVSQDRAAVSVLQLYRPRSCKVDAWSCVPSPPLAIRNHSAACQLAPFPSGNPLAFAASAERSRASHRMVPSSIPPEVFRQRPSLRTRHDSILLKAVIAAVSGLTRVHVCKL